MQFTGRTPRTGKSAESIKAFASAQKIQQKLTDDPNAYQSGG
jgi:hypothetical protein